MAGTREGGLKSVAKIKARYGEDFFVRMGRIGGKKGRTGGFASEKIGEDGLTGLQRAVLAGRKGGRISRRTSKKNIEVEIVEEVAGVEVRMEQN